MSASIHPNCEKCGKRVYPAELQSMEKRIFHHGCLRCEEPTCNKILGGNNWGGFLDNEAYCKIHLNRVAQATGRSTSSTKKWVPKVRDPNAPKSKFGSGVFDKCVACGKTVYPAEKMSMEGRIYHTGGCLKCVECGVKLGGANWGGYIPTDSNNGYCKVHRNQHLAKTGGAGLATTKWVPKASTGEKRSSRFGGGNHEKCTGCGKTVYPAEKMSMEGRVYHPGCLRCVECNVKLGGANWGGYLPTDSTNGYCKVHRDQKLAKTGGATKVTWKKKENTGGEKRSSRFGSIPRDKCEICGKTVYPAEKLLLEKKIFHNGCVRCKECGKSVTGANFGNFVGNDNTAYCKVHYDRLIATIGDSTKISGSTGQWTGQ